MKEGLMIATAVNNSLFLAFTAVSGIPSSEKSCASIYLPGITLNHFTYKKGVAPRWFFAVLL